MNMGTGGDIGVYMLAWGFISAILLLIGLPVWFWKEFQSLHRTVRFLREDIELQQVEIKELKDKLGSVNSTQEPIDESSW